MTKRAFGKFKCRPQDAYDTPREAVLPLLPHLPRRCSFLEFCAGAGDLWRHLERAGHQCSEASDTEPRGPGVITADAFDLCERDFRYHSFRSADFIITNPPWTRQILHPMIDHFRSLRPTWLLFDADWMHTKQAIPYLKYCHKIVSVGRVSWMQNGTSGLDNCAWYLFDQEEAATQFVGRAA